MCDLTVFSHGCNANTFFVFTRTGSHSHCTNVAGALCFEREGIFDYKELNKETTETPANPILRETLSG